MPHPPALFVLFSYVVIYTCYSLLCQSWQMIRFFISAPAEFLDLVFQSVTS